MISVSPAQYITSTLWKEEKLRYGRGGGGWWSSKLHAKERKRNKEKDSRLKQNQTILLYKGEHFMQEKYNSKDSWKSLEKDMQNISLFSFSFLFFYHNYPSFNFP